MKAWEYTSEDVPPSKSWYDVLREKGRDGWEAWHMESEDGWRSIYFKRPAER